MFDARLNFHLIHGSRDLIYFGNTES